MTHKKALKMLHRFDGKLERIWHIEGHSERFERWLQMQETLLHKMDEIKPI